MGAHAIISVHPPARENETRENTPPAASSHARGPPRPAAPPCRARARSAATLRCRPPPSPRASATGSFATSGDLRATHGGASRVSDPGGGVRLAAQREVVRGRALGCADVGAQHAQHAQRDGRRRRGDRGGLPDPRGCGVGATGHARQRPRARRRAGATVRGRAGAGWSARPVRSGKRGGGLGAAGEGGEVARYARYAGMGARGRGLWRAAPPPRRLSSAV